MSKLSKIVVTILVIVGFIVLFSIIINASQFHTPGFLGLIVAAGMIGAIRAVWKKDHNDNNNDSAILQK